MSITHPTPALRGNRSLIAGAVIAVAGASIALGLPVVNGSPDATGSPVEQPAVRGADMSAVVAMTHAELAATYGINNQVHNTDLTPITHLTPTELAATYGINNPVPAP